MTIIHRRLPEVKLDQNQTDMIHAKRLTSVDADPSGETPPQFLQSIFSQGVIWITCTHEPSKDWLMRAVGDLEERWEFADLTGRLRTPPEETQDACSHF
jgi:hypothetical protein